MTLITQVPDEILIDRCVGRWLDPTTGKIYHIKNFPPETEEIKARLITRPDDTEEKVQLFSSLCSAHYAKSIAIASFHFIFTEIRYNKCAR